MVGVHTGNDVVVAAADMDWERQPERQRRRGEVVGNGIHKEGNTDMNGAEEGSNNEEVVGNEDGKHEDVVDSFPGRGAASGRIPGHTSRKDWEEVPFFVSSLKFLTAHKL